MAQFRIESYELKAASHNHEHTIRLLGPKLSHGLRNRVSIYFRPLPLSFAAEGVIGYAYNAEGHDQGGISFGVWFKEHTFTQVYSILQSEDPIDFHYQLKNIASSPASTSKHVVSAHVAVGAEPTGKGVIYDGSSMTSSRALEPEAYADGASTQGQAPLPNKHDTAQPNRIHLWQGWRAAQYVHPTSTSFCRF